MKVVGLVIVALIALAILLPILHLIAAVLVVAGGVIVVMAAWKVLFGAPSAAGRPGGPQALP